MRPEEIARAVRRSIRERIFSPGQVLNQDELARQYGVSRIPLREALRTLAGEGLIVINPGMGAVVTELDPQEVDELYGLRLLLEPSLAEAILDHVGRRDIADLAGLVERLAQAADTSGEDWSAALYAFHRRMFELSGRRHTVRLVVQVLNLVEPYARLHAQESGNRGELTKLCRAMLAELEAGDGGELRTLIERSITTTRESLVG